MKKDATIIMGCVLVFVFILGFMTGIMMRPSTEQSNDVLPSYELQDRDWQPDNYWDLWLYNFSFDNQAYRITIDSELECPQSIILDIRFKVKPMRNFLTDPDPSIEVNNGDTAKPSRTNIHGDTLRQIWLVSGLNPDQTYTFIFHGNGVCGRFTEE